MHQHGEEGEPDLLHVGSLVELVHHLDGNLAGQSLQLDVVLQRAFGEQTVLDGEAQGLEKLLVVGNAQEQDLAQVSAEPLAHPPESHHVHLLGLSQSYAGLVTDDSESTGQLRVVHLGLAGALPPSAGCLAQE